MGSQTFEAENITLLQEAHPGPYNFYYLYYTISGKQQQLLKIYWIVKSHSGQCNE